MKRRTHLHKDRTEECTTQFLKEIKRLEPSSYRLRQQQKRGGISMENEKTYGVWAVRNGTSMFGYAEAWCKENGKTLEFDECLVLASPIHYITKDMPPVLLHHGDIDTICPIDQSMRFSRAAVAAAREDRVAFTILPGAEYGDSAFETAENMETVKAFLDKYLKEEQ